MFSFLAILPVTGNSSVFDLIWGTGIVVKLVLLILLLFSIFSWAIILAKYIIIRQSYRESESFLDEFYTGKPWDKLYKAADEYRNASLANIFQAGHHELQKEGYSSHEKGKEGLGGLENIMRALKRAVLVERTKLEKAVSFLATTGSITPFIGLFGTVWGIMNSFREIGARGAAGIQVVGPGIAEALIATAAGLAAAIPAVIAYNYFVSKIRFLTVEMDNFSADFINVIKRDIYHH